MDEVGPKQGDCTRTSKGATKRAGGLYASPIKNKNKKQKTKLFFKEPTFLFLLFLFLSIFLLIKPSSKKR
jgi:hypothetical protein